jgi:diguanylate cyclase (GGDEF)-like protein
MPTQSVVTVLIVAIVGNLLLMLFLIATLSVRRRDRAAQAVDSTGTDRTAGAAHTRASLHARPSAGGGTDAAERPALGDGWLDPLTGLDGRLAWEHAVRDEDARHERYRRPLAVVVVELDGLSRLSERFGSGPEERIVRAVGDALERNARGSDKVARVDQARFHVLLAETDEIAAINYVERVRLACDRWLESGAIALRLSLGWASPAAGGNIATALHVAEDRLVAERRQAGSGTPRLRTVAPLQEVEPAR